jgi:hypothetical protein
VQVRYDEGVAIHIDPEPCAVACEGGSEASAEEHIGQPLSPAKIHIPGADAVAKAEGYTDGRVSASAWRTRRGRRTWHVWKLVAREPGGPTSGQSQGSDLVCIGKARSHSR